jgi:hypothetical protein
MDLNLNTYLKKRQSSITLLTSPVLVSNQTGGALYVGDSSSYPTIWFPWSEESQISLLETKEEIAEYNRKCIEIVNLHLLTLFFEQIQDKGYEIVNSKELFSFLNKKDNHFLHIVINQTIDKLEETFKGSLKKIYLELTYDSEEETTPIVFIKIKTDENIQTTYEKLIKFKKEWFIPVAQDNILSLNVDFI